MREGIRKGLISRGMFPVFCVCAGKDMGVRRLMEFLGNVVPFVSDMPKVINTAGTEVAFPVDGGDEFVPQTVTLDQIALSLDAETVLGHAVAVDFIFTNSHSLTPLPIVWHNASSVPR